jgi:hypothetical protein
VIGGCTPDRRLQVRLTDEQAHRVEVPVSAECTFAFEGLAAGLYTVELVGFADVASRSDIALDGKNAVGIELMLPVEDTFSAAALRRRSSTPVGMSVIAGSAPESAGRVAKLTDSVGNEVRQVVNPDNTFRFEGLMPGLYLLTIEGGYEQPGLIVDGENGQEVIFQTLKSTWEAKVSPAGSMPGFSVVRVEVEGMRGLPVYIWKEDWEGMMRRTGSKQEYGECAAEFSPLGPGHYMVEPEGIGVWVDVELTGLEVVWIDFRRKNVPTSPNIVQPLARQATMPPSLSTAPSPSTPEEAATPVDHAPVDTWEVGGFAAESGDSYDEPTFGDEPAFGDETAEPSVFDAHVIPQSPSESERELEGTAPASPTAESGEDEPSWLSSLASSSAMDFHLPSLTRGKDDEDDFDDELEGLTGDFEEDDAFDDESVDESARNPASEFPEQEAVRSPLALLIPTPVTDVDDLAALLHFVKTTQSVMARTVDEVPDGSRVLLIGTVGTEEWSEIEGQLALRGLRFEKVSQKLSDALADDSLSGL